MRSSPSCREGDSTSAIVILARNAPKRGARDASPHLPVPVPPPSVPLFSVMHRGGLASLEGLTHSAWVRRHCDENCAPRGGWNSSSQLWPERDREHLSRFAYSPFARVRDLPKRRLLGSLSPSIFLLGAHKPRVVLLGGNRSATTSAKVRQFARNRNRSLSGTFHGTRLALLLHKIPGE